MGTRRIRRNRNVGNKLNDIDSRIASVEKKTVQDSSIGSTQIATEGVSTDNVQNRAVTSEKIELGAVGSEHLGLVNDLSSGGNLSLNIGSGGHVVINGTKYESPYGSLSSADGILATGFNPTTNALVVVPNTAGFMSPNYLINGAFDFWQRGISGSPTGSTNAYVADRWECFRSGYAAGMNISRFAASLTGFQYCARVQRAAGNTSTANMLFCQSLETISSIPLAGKTVTLSFYARAGANYSASSNDFAARIVTGTGTDNSFRVGYTGYAETLKGFTLTTSWVRYTLTGTLSSSATQVGITFSYAPVGTAGANDYFEVAGVQLEDGSTATPFRRNANSIQAELAACQRYFIASTAGAFADGALWSGYAVNATLYYAKYTFPVQMRTTTPTVTLTNISQNGFGTTPGSTTVGWFGFYEARACTATTNSGYFGSSYTASAEL